ncbi:MAG: carbohydrate-binding family 9-like protein [Armatimonadetes bacterium]|nr:carbohydrate-binding family 9-like protein [Armatimonadota bacterium]
MERLKVPRCHTPPPLDGRLSGVWLAGAEVRPLPQHDGRPAIQETAVRLVYDSHHLYVAFRCHDNDIWGTLHERDDPIYDEEVVEVFLDPEGAGRRYFEIEVSPHNVVLDGINTWDNGELRWDDSWDCAGLRTAVAMDGDAGPELTADRWWSATLAIPFDALGLAAPRAGEAWRANLYRIERSRRTGEEFQAWRPTQQPGEPPMYNVPARFGWLEFG